MRFVLNNIDWNILVVPQNDLRLIVDNGACYGATSFREQEIYIDGSLPKAVFRQTVIHELVHAFKWSYGMYFPNVDVDEVISDFMGAHLWTIYGLTRRIMKECYRGVDNA